MTRVIRPAAARDVRNLAALATQVWLHTYALEGVRDALSDYVLQELTPAKFSALLSQPEIDLLVCEQESCLLGYLKMNSSAACPQDEENTTEIETVYVQEHHIGTGAGRALLDAACEVARARGAQKLWLSVYHENAAALAFYDRLDFQMVGDTWWRWDDERYRNLVLTRKL